MSPDSGSSSEYQSRVSPIVLSGGRSNDIHIKTI